ncbi:MAG: fasciclin domain-containing protein [Gammaproteobacteria bacterium]
MNHLLIYSTCALTLGAMSGAVDANMCMKRPYGHHAYMTPMHAYGMHRYPGPMQSYGYPAHQYDKYSHKEVPVKKARKVEQPQKYATAPETQLLPSQGPDIIEVAAVAGDFHTLIKAVVAADLYDTLRGDGPFTVFAPTDAAFAKLPEGTLEGLLADKEKLAAVLSYHVVPGRVTAADILQQRELETVQGQRLSIDSLSVVSADIETANGIIHVIDSVLIPGS